MKTLVLTVLFVLGLCAAAGAGEPAPAVIILDASGSMAAREPGGEAKLDVAKKIVADTIGRWPPGGSLALLAYGHRRKADCADIETLVDMGPVSAKQVLRQLKTLRARGKTPLSQSLRQAARLLPADGGGSIVLVSDGIETCAADPCAVAAELRQVRPSLIVLVVGFGLARGEAAQLSCIAENGGGKFFDAGSASQLAETLDIIKEEIAAAPRVPEPAARPAPAPEPAPLPEPVRVVRVGLSVVASGIGPVEVPVRWTVADAKQETVYAGESRALFLDLATGTYEAVAKAANAQGKARIVITGDEGQSFNVEVEAGQLDLALAANRSAAPFGDAEAAGVEWMLEPLEGQGQVEIPGLARPSLLLAPGRYSIGARLKGLEASTVATVTPGAAAAATLDFRLGTLVLEAALESAAPPIDDPAMLSWRVGEGDRAQTVSGQARPRLVLQEGRYPVALTIMGAQMLAEAEVVAAEERVSRVMVGGGELALSARLGPGAAPIEDWRDAFWTFEPAGTLAPATAIEVQAAAPVVPMPPGRWRIGLKSGAVTVEKDVMVAPGGRTTLDIDLGAARLTVLATPAAGERAANTVYSVFALDGVDVPAAAPIYETGSAEDMSTILPAGKWRVAASDSDGRRGQADIVLGSGEERSLEIALD